MKIKIFKLVDNSFIVGEILETSSTNVWLKFPATLTMISHQGQPAVRLIDFIPAFYADFNGMVKKVRLQKIHILFFGNVDKNIKDLYLKYTADLIKRISDIQLATPADLKHIPSMGKA